MLPDTTTPQTSPVSAPATPQAPEPEPAPEPSGLDLASRAAQRARKASSRRRDEQSRADALAHQTALAQSENAHLKNQMAEVLAFQQALKTDPFKALKQLGITERQIAERVVQEGSPEAALRDFKAELAQERAKREALEASIAAEKTQIAERRAEKDLIALVRGDGKTVYPNLAKQPTTIVVDLVRGTLNEIAARKGSKAIQGIGFADILKHLERQYAKQPDATPEEVLAASDSKPAQKKASPTLTNKLGTERHSVPANFDSLSDKEQRKILAEKLRTRK